MKANIAFLHGPEDLRIEKVELPPLKPNEILIKLKACGICGSDVECFEGKSDEGRYDIAPYTPGHEWAGQAVEVGSAVTSVKPGNKVVGDCVLPCFNCANCKDGKMPSACLNMREVGFRPDSPGGMGEYMILEECYTHVIPDDWHYELGAWVETFNVGYWGVWGNGCDPDASDNCVIIGAGPIGLCASMVCKTAGAQVVVTDPMPARRETIQKYGADFTIDPRDIGDDPAIPNYVKKIYECFGGKIYREGKLIKREGGPTVVIECSSNDAGIASVFDIAGHSARVGFVGHSIGRKVPVEIGKTIWSTLKMKGSGGTSLWFPRTIRFLSRIKDRYDFAALNTHHFNFRDIHKAFDVAVHDKANARKVMLTFDE